MHCTGMQLWIGTDTVPYASIDKIFLRLDKWLPYLVDKAKQLENVEDAQVRKSIIEKNLQLCRAEICFVTGVVSLKAL